MYSKETGYYKTMEDYRAAESEYHTELMGISRRYLSKLGIVSLMGVLDIVKQEIMELEQATKKNLDHQATKQKPMEVQEADYF